MEENNKKCPECGSTDFGEGVLMTQIQPKNAVFASSRIMAKVCKKCGMILEMRVVDPEKF